MTDDKFNVVTQGVKCPYCGKFFESDTKYEWHIKGYHSTVKKSRQSNSKNTMQGEKHE